jgi:hypothetical protein
MMIQPINLTMTDNRNFRDVEGVCTYFKLHFTEVGQLGAHRQHKELKCPNLVWGKPLCPIPWFVETAYIHRLRKPDGDSINMATSGGNC